MADFEAALKEAKASLSQEMHDFYRTLLQDRE
jgi:hypothetical protein